MTLDSWDNDIAAVTINNESGGEWSCGEFYELQVLIDGVWYEIPAMPGNWGFNCMGFYIPDGGKQSMINHLTMYGELPSGNIPSCHQGIVRRACHTVILSGTRCGACWLGKKAAF